MLRRCDRTISRVIKRAIRNGYRVGDFIQGGGYALNAELLRRASVEGFISRPLDYLWQFFSEDVLATIICFAVRMNVDDCNQSGDVFGVAYSHLSGSPAELIAEDYAIIHSTKNAMTPEAEITAYFRSVRDAHRAGRGAEVKQ